ncbi:hypothetical protein CS063_02465 [Sporanaerobium hydrogeniformans]|uniref:Uncharacterized protein n=1 Tax=Sporanaerobium hydrogeniformans TaxID=3072179 RepID=A0AC61DGP4_9FIRM|nr:SpoIIIAH-like family protein [Sporanaerobium hydrogeniformans]PHV72361.1 hypothetical protein CS063_02465 [Sporanaerobium hydrogeniformans]
MFTFKRNQIIITVLVFMIAVAAYLNTKEPVAGVKPQLVEVPGEEMEEKDFFENYNSVIQELPPDGEEVSLSQVEPNQMTVTNETVAPNQAIDANQAVDSKQVVDANQAVDSSQAIDASQVVDSNQVLITKNTAPQSFTATITKKEMLNSEEVAEASSNKNLEVSYFVEEKILREQSRAEQIEQLSQYVANESLDKESKSKAAASLLAIQERIEKESSAEALLRAKGFKEVYVRIDEDSVDVVINKADLTDSDIAQIEEIVNRKTGYSVGKIKITPLKGLSQDAQNK